MREGNESEKKYIQRRFREASSIEDLDRIEEELKKEGIKKSSIAPRKSERKKELRQISIIPSGQKGSGTLSAEQIIERLPWPVDDNGRVSEAFRAGQMYEAMNVIRGIRLAQELSKMGIEQASPLIKMATEMREAESKAASQAAQVAAAGVGQMLQPQIERMENALKQATLASSPNPFAAMSAEIMKPLFQQVLGGVVSSLTRVFQPQALPQAPDSQGTRLEEKGPPPAEHLKPGEEASEWMEV